MRWIWGLLIGLIVVWPSTALNSLTQQADPDVLATVSKSAGNHALSTVNIKPNAGTSANLPATQPAEQKVSNVSPTATPKIVPPDWEPIHATQTTDQPSIMPWILVGIGLLSAVGAWVGWRRSQV